ncbi:MAG TPA: TetR/AcrR family transcriptional regulator [Gammaproteobacteria bacterium]|nr:TetR/AcrR family transcriptional regulator [Gammaproteobacteria bacterium]
MTVPGDNIAECAPPDYDGDPMRAQILEAAQRRFQTYGFTKTTMAEIASDLGMSAANLYRYFHNKQDIVAACATRCMGERIERLAAVVTTPGQSAADTLLAYVLDSLRHTHQLAAEQPRINELVETVTELRPDIVHWKIAAESRLLEAILKQGNESGEFEVADVAATACTIQAMLVKFHLPLFMSLFSLEEQEQQARSAVALLLRGLEKR